MRQHFRVCVGFEFVSRRYEPLFQLVVIFNHAVVDDGDFSRLVKVRMRIFVGRNSVRGPACVRDAKISGDGLRFQQPRDALVNLAELFSDNQVRAVQDRHPRAVVTAILQSPQAFEQDGRS